MFTRINRKPGFWYLALVPYLSAIIGFAAGGFPDTVTYPVWLLHSCLMVFLFLHSGPNAGPAALRWRRAGWFLFLPWVLFSVFAGFGPPPDTPAVFLTLVTQQQIRYSLLAIGAVLLVTGFQLLSHQLNVRGRNRYVSIAKAILYPGAILFILNMLYWGFYLAHAFRQLDLDNPVRPGWYMAMREWFNWVGLAGVGLCYLSTALFSLSLKQYGLLGSKTANVFCGISLAAMLLVFIPASAPMPLSGLAYFLSIPAIPFILPYHIGLTLAFYPPLLAESEHLSPLVPMKTVTGTGIRRQ